MMKNTFKSVICIALSLLTIFLAACSKNGDGDKTDYRLWSCPQTTKILRDSDYSDAEFAKPASVTIDTVKNEYESAQIIISANKAVNSYTVSMGDLTSDLGDIYSYKNVAIYNVKYVNVYKPYNDNGMTAGEYPDALLPMDNAVIAGENRVKAGNNQSVCFSFKTPVNQKSGVYRGDVTLTVDGNVDVVPVTVRVREAELASDVNTRSLFLSNWQYYLGEYESSQRMLDAYNKALIRYRLAPATIVTDSVFQADDAEYYAEKAYELCAGHGMTNFAIPISNPFGDFTQNLIMYIKALFKKSWETDYNLIDRAYVYAIDEPEANNLFSQTKAFAEHFRNALSGAVTEILVNKAAYGVTAENQDFFNEIVGGIEQIKNVVTNAYSEEYAPYVETWCPTVDGYENVSNLEHYNLQDERWWYTCLNPTYPYPTLHIDDYLVSSRVLGWLMLEYNVKGNLYWGVNVYASYQNDKYDYFDDYYADANHFASVNGDGFLFYPGAKYGVEGPLPTVRIESLRDGLEEYELLLALKNRYKAMSQSADVDFGADEIIGDIVSPLFTGTQVTADDETFASSRKQLLDLIEFTESGICFISYDDDNKGNVSYSLYVPNNAELTAEGIVQQAAYDVSGGHIVIYSVDKKTEQADTALFKATANGKSYSVSFDLPGLVKLIAAENLADKLGGNATSSTVAAGGVNSDYSGEWLKLQIPQTLSNSYQDVTLSGNLGGSLTSSVSKLVCGVYLEGSGKETNILLTVKFKNSSAPVVAYSGRLVEGYNELIWKGVSAFNWPKLGEVDYIMLRIGEKNDPAREDIYLTGFTVYYE